MKAFFAGFAFIRRSPAIFGVISLDLFAVLLGGVTALLPVFARDVFAAGPWGLGLLRAAPAVGALTMALALTRWPIERNAGKMMFAAVAGFGLSADRVRIDRTCSRSRSRRSRCSAHPTW